MAAGIEHRAEKWAPVFGKSDAKTKSYGKRADSQNRQFAIGAFAGLRRMAAVTRLS
jgi:hypothetical protein